jgi:hypothetical protein
VSVIPIMYKERFKEPARNFLRGIWDGYLMKIASSKIQDLKGYYTRKQ